VEGPRRRRRRVISTLALHHLPSTAHLEACFDEIARIAGTGRTAARAVHEAFDGYRTALAAAGPYLAARVADLDDVRQRVVAACLGVAVPGVPDPGCAPFWKWPGVNLRASPPPTWGSSSGHA